jgi:hypothetical protein
MRDEQRTEDGNVSKACADCGDVFAVSPGERKFFESRGFHQPVRCLRCRRVRQVERLREQLADSRIGAEP